MNKYSRFGISFSKHTLTEKGANPVFYVATDSLVREQLPSVRDTDWQGKPTTEYSRRQYLDRLISVLHGRRDQLFSRLGRSCLVPDNDPEKLSDGDFTLLVQLEVLLRAVDKHFLSFCVPFAAACPDEHPDNYYFEREWRALGNVTFTLTDVRRIFLPCQWAKVLREQVPEYCGQIHFTDT